MIAAGDKIIVFSLIPIIMVAGSILIGLIAWAFFQIRTGGKKLALRQFRKDYPTEEIVNSSIRKVGSRTYVDFYTRSGKSICYNIAKDVEEAFEVKA